MSFDTSASLYLAVQVKFITSNCSFVCRVRNTFVGLKLPDLKHRAIKIAK